MSDSEFVIRVEGLSKCYRLGQKQEKNDSLVGSVVDFIKSPLENYRKYRSLYDFSDSELSGFQDQDIEGANVLWALREVSVDVQAGEVLGVIGTNGSGKSTFLKILSRITAPTRGRVELHGRVASLLEVGTGFHPELTGRENIFLNGTILGMKKKEIERNFDRIVDFSGVETFLDTPVKRYSSGMRVRLAFAVAAHLEPEILVIDEVLAVGDAEFQKKCLNKMQDVGREGRTVLFVSHNMAAVTRLCERVILLDKGKVLGIGTAEEMVNQYLTSGAGTSASREWSDISEAPGDDVVRLHAVGIRDEAGELIDMLDVRKPAILEMEYEVLESGEPIFPYFRVSNDRGIGIFTTLDQDPSWRNERRSPGWYISRVWIPGNFLAEGTHFVSVGMRTFRSQMRHFKVPDILAFRVFDPCEGDSARGDWVGGLGGVVRPLLKWETEYSKRRKSFDDRPFLSV